MTLGVQNWPTVDSNYYNNLFYCQPKSNTVENEIIQ